MIVKGSYLITLDKNGVWFVCVFHMYFGFWKKFARFGNFVLVSVKKTKSVSLVLKKSKVKCIFIVSAYLQKKHDGAYLKFQVNGCILLKRRLTSFGREIIGPVNYLLGRKRFLFSFAGLI